MRRLRLLAFAFFLALFIGPGCASDADKGQWAQFWKDLRGDNMQMGSHDPKPP